MRLTAIDKGAWRMKATLQDSPSLSRRAFSAMAAEGTASCLAFSVSFKRGQHREKLYAGKRGYHSVLSVSRATAAASACKCKRRCTPSCGSAAWARLHLRHGSLRASPAAHQFFYRVSHVTRHPCSVNIGAASQTIIRARLSRRFPC
jgi:hypothetical protein